MEVTKKILSEYYLGRKLSTREIAKLLGVSQWTVCRKLKEFGIKARSYSENKMPVPKGSKLLEAHRKAISDHHKNDPNWHTKNRLNEDHYNWKGGVRVYRTKKLSTVPLACSACGAREIVRKRSNLYVHHIDEDRSNNSLDNLQVLCASCHRKTHNLSKPD